MSEEMLVSIEIPVFATQDGNIPEVVVFGQDAELRNAHLAENDGKRAIRQDIQLYYNVQVDFSLFPEGSIREDAYECGIVDICPYYEMENGNLDLIISDKVLKVIE